MKQALSMMSACSLLGLALLSPADTNWNLRASRTIEVFPDRLRVTSELLPTGDVPAERITNWSVVQLPPPPRVAVRLTERKRIANGIGEDKPLPGPVRLDDSLVFDLRSAEASGKCSFDADRFLVDVPGGQLEIRQLGETLDDGLATPERAQLYFAARAELPPGYEPYIATRAFWEGKGFVQIDCIDPLPGWQPGNPSAIYVLPLA